MAIGFTGHSSSPEASLGCGCFLSCSPKQRKKLPLKELPPSCLPHEAPSLLIPMMFQGLEEGLVCWLQTVGGVGRIAHHMYPVSLHEPQELEVEYMAGVAIQQQHMWSEVVLREHVHKLPPHSKNSSVVIQPFSDTFNNVLEKISASCLALQLVCKRLDILPSKWETSLGKGLDETGQVGFTLFGKDGFATRIMFVTLDMTLNPLLEGAFWDIPSTCNHELNMASHAPRSDVIDTKPIFF
ncbi:hypothetical protein ABVT39_022163 [Epinephelus coioides]